MNRQSHCPGPWHDCIANVWREVRFNPLSDIFLRTRYGITKAEALKVFRWVRDSEKDGSCPV